MDNTYQGKNVIITGGLGFIGSNLAIRLVDLGAKVTIVDAKILETGWNLKNIDPIKDKIKLSVHNINSEKMVPLIKKADYLFNLAGVLSHVDALANPLHDLEINTVDHLKLLLMCHEHNPELKIIYTGTRNQYGRILKNPVKEEYSFNPIDPNGISEIATEMYHNLYYKLFGLRSVSLRLCNVFGPRHQMRHSKQGVLNWFIRQVMDGAVINLMGGGEQIRDCIYIDDLVEALVILGETNNVWGEEFNIGCFPISLKSFVENVIKVSGDGKFTVTVFPPDRKVIEIGDYIADYTKLKKFTNWKPKYRLEEAIQLTIDYYQKNKKYYW